MLISIVIPTRDRIGLLADAIATIIPQNGYDYESASLTMLRLTQYANTFTICRIRAFVWPELRLSLSPSESEWAIAVKLLLSLRSKRMHPIVESRVIPQLLRRVSPDEFDPVQRFCDRGSYSKRDGCV
jgi:hypothetical protein